MAVERSFSELQKDCDTMSLIVSLFCILLVKNNLVAPVNGNEGVLEKIKKGIQYSKTYFETAKEIADLVSESLVHNVQKPKGDRNNGFNKSSKLLNSENIASAFFRLLGLDSTRIAAIAVNSAIFLAHTISSLFSININPGQNTRRNTHDRYNDFNLLEFIKNTRNEKLHNLLEQAQNRELPQQLIDQVIGLDSECIKLLLCKASPVILAVQGSLNERFMNKRHQLSSWLPKREIFEKNSNACEVKYLECNIFPEMDEDSTN